ncbi:hypothetical protein RU08_06020 [Pseudomonas fulva]|uniref:Uncharacterized protein n=1 Tax=Pseudomonas fulva TaxID=47880 RepID=A0A0D0JD67_9PSED|nr:hypothetical protein RU08_06020 [Pseudomonas fulva]
MSGIADMSERQNLAGGVSGSQGRVFQQVRTSISRISGTGRMLMAWLAETSLAMKLRELLGGKASDCALPPFSQLSTTE